MKTDIKSYVKVDFLLFGNFNKNPVIKNLMKSAGTTAESCFLPVLFVMPVIRCSGNGVHTMYEIQN